MRSAGLDEVVSGALGVELAGLVLCGTTEETAGVEPDVWTAIELELSTAVEGCGVDEVVSGVGDEVAEEVVFSGCVEEDGITTTGSGFWVEFRSSETLVEEGEGVADVDDVVSCCVDETTDSAVAVEDTSQVGVTG